MADEIRENIDSREGFNVHQHDMYCAECGDTISMCACADDPTGSDEPSQTDLEEMTEFFEQMDLDDDYYEDDGQPSEYEEYQDLYGGDDWDFGQYDEY